MRIEIPGYRTLDLKYLILDYNGTIAVDGVIRNSVKKKLYELSSELEIFVLTADTHGTAKENCMDLPVKIQTFPNDSVMAEKCKVVRALGEECCVALGNGRNDALMLQISQLSIAVMDAEGVYSGLVNESDVCVRSVEDALDLLLCPKRLIATMRG